MIGAAGGEAEPASSAGMGRAPLRDLLALLLLWSFWATWYAPGVFGGRIPVWEDTAAYFFSNRATLYAIAHGTGFSWWDPLPMLGLPRLANIQNGSFSPISVLFYLVPTARVFAFFPALTLGLLSSFSFGLFRVCGVGRIAAVFGALSWSTVGHVVAHVQHASAIDTLLWLPATLLAWECCRRCRTGRWRQGGWAVLAGLGIAFQCFGALPQYVLYNGLVMAMWIGLGVFRSQRGGGSWLRELALALSVGVIGLGLASWQLLPFLEMAQHSHRSLLPALDGFQDHFRAAPHEVALSLAAEVFTWIEAPTLAHGAPYKNFPNVTLLALGFAVLAVVRRPRAIAEGGFAVFFLLGMLGTAGGVTSLIAVVFPFAEQLRAPLRMIIPAAFWISWLAALGLQRWLDAGPPRRALLGAFAAVWIAALAWGLQRPSTVYVEPRFFRVPDVIATASPRLAADFRSSPRMPLFGLNAGIAAGVPSLFVREVLIPRRFFEAYFASQFGSLDQQDRLARMMTTLVQPLFEPSKPILRAFGLTTLIRYRSGRYQAIELPEAVPRFRLVSETIVADDPGERWALAASDAWDPARQAIVSQPVALPSSALHEEPPPGRVRVLRDEPDHHLLEVDSPGGLLVTSGLFFPGWQVWIDGALAGPLEADLALRGVVVPPGTHRVEWRYRPTWLPLAWAGSALAILTALVLPAALRRSG